MNKDLNYIKAYLIGALKAHGQSLKTALDTPEKFEVKGTIEAMQGKKKVDGIYFASVVPKPKDVRFYFFPTYTHAEELKKDMPEALQKCLKGKSCFHIKGLDESLEKSIKDLVEKGVEVYKRDGLL
ncbi:MAG TPA: hypothetical protein ENJ95_04735 [Bacteroidetes bacterium]|nr:hypothetical protein [Bacteroidota bacterium]